MIFDTQEQPRFDVWSMLRRVGIALSGLGAAGFSFAAFGFQMDHPTLTQTQLFMSEQILFSIGAAVCGVICFGLLSVECEDE